MSPQVVTRPTCVADCLEPLACSDRFLHSTTPGRPVPALDHASKTVANTSILRLTRSLDTYTTFDVMDNTCLSTRILTGPKC